METMVNETGGFRMKRCFEFIAIMMLICSLFSGCLKNAQVEPAQAETSQESVSDLKDESAAVPPAADSVTLKFAHFSNEMHPIHDGAVEFAKAVKERTNGEVLIEIYPNKELGSPMELLEQVSLGSIDFNVGTLSDLGRYSSRFYAVQTPFLFEGYEHAHKVLDSPEFQEWVQPDLDENNFCGLGFWEYGFRNTTTKGIEVNSPEDLKGVKIRVPKVAQLEECFAALGAVTEKIDYNELYLAMKQGVADGQENPVGVIKADKLYEVQDQLAITNHMYESVMLIMNSKSWNKLTDEQKAVIEEEGRRCGDLVRESIISSENSDIEELKSYGMNVTTPELEPFKTMMESAYKNIAEVCGQENVNKMMEFAENEK